MLKVGYGRTFFSAQVMVSLKDHVTELAKPSNLSLVMATVWVITKVYPSTSRGPTLIGQYAETKIAYIEQNYLIEAILQRVSLAPSTRALIESDHSYEGQRKYLHDFFSNLNNVNLLYRLNANKRKAVWFVDSIESFGRLENDILNERNHIHRSGFFCIIYTGRNVDRLVTMQTIFFRLFKLYIININILMSFGSTVKIYTYYPFTRNECQSMKPHVYGLYGPLTNYKFSRDTFFPKKLWNMWGCTVNVTTWTEIPFVKIDFNRKTGKVLRLEGIEGMLLKLLAEHMNFSIRIVEEPNKLVGGGEDAGSIKMLSDGLTNISIVGLIVDKQRQKFSDAAYTYIQVPINFAIPLGKMLTPIERLTRPFKYIIWSCLSSSLLCGVAIIFLLKAFWNRAVRNFVFGESNRIPFTNLLSAFYGGPIANPLPRRNFARFLVGVWLFYTLVVRSAYLAQLFLILQDSRARSQLSTVSEVLSQNFTLYSYPVIVPIIKGATSLPLNIEAMDNFESTLVHLFRRLSKDENAKIAATVLGHVIRAYNQDPKNQNVQVNVLEEAIVNAPLTFYMRKHSYFASHMNGVILNAMSAGLLSKFEKLYLIDTGQSPRKSDPFVSIPMSQLIGLFVLHMTLLMLSTIVFLCEILSKRSPLTKIIINFFNY